MTKLKWLLFGVLAVGVGLYPALYFLEGFQGGLLNSKSEELLNSFWIKAFYVHIIPGGMALLVGWPQFSVRLRKNRMALHRVLGKMYMIAVAFSGFAGLYISINATGGIVAKLGFGCLAIVWLFSTFMGWKKVRKGKIIEHQQWMIRSYALCFAAVTLRIWLPSFIITGLPFLTGYVIISWLCWVPNLIVAEMIISRQKSKNVLVNS